MPADSRNLKSGRGGTKSQARFSRGGFVFTKKTTQGGGVPGGERALTKYRDKTRGISLLRVMEGEGVTVGGREWGRKLKRNGGGLTVRRKALKERKTGGGQAKEKGAIRERGKRGAERLTSP